MYVCLGGKFSFGHNFPALKLFFLLTTRGPESNFQFTLAKRPESSKGILLFTLAKRPESSKTFRIYREKVQNSRSAFTGWENFICPSRVDWLPPSLGGSGLSGANFMWESLHQHGARWPLLRAYKSFPHPSATRGGSFMAPPPAKVGQKFCFMLPPPASPLSGRPPVRLKLCNWSCLSPLSSHPPFSKGE